MLTVAEGGGVRGTGLPRARCKGLGRGLGRAQRTAVGALESSTSSPVQQSAQLGQFSDEDTQFSPSALNKSGHITGGKYLNSLNPAPFLHAQKLWKNTPPCVCKKGLGRVYGGKEIPAPFFSDSLEYSVSPKTSLGVRRDCDCFTEPEFDENTREL